MLIVSRNYADFKDKSKQEYIPVGSVQPASVATSRCQYQR